MSDLKRVAFTTLTNNVNVGGSGGSVGGNSNSNVADGISINSKKALQPPLSSVSSSAGPGLSSVATAGAAAAAAVSVSTAIPSESVTSRQQQTSTKTIRLELQLFEPDSGSSPEFNYLELVKIEKKKLKKISRINGFPDPFEENDDEVARIAKEFEKKYGGGTVAASRRRCKKDDLFDKGAGYDESDSFIDNTEAYDEIIPDEVETVEGGFYINSGALEFKHLSNYDRTEEVVKIINKPRKRPLSTSSSSSGEDDGGGGGGESNEAEEETEGNSSPRENLLTNTALKLKNGHLDKKHKNGRENSDKESGSSTMKISAPTPPTPPPPPPPPLSAQSLPQSALLSSSSLLKHSKDKQQQQQQQQQHQQQRSENIKPKLKDDIKVDEMYVDPIKDKDKEKTVKTTTVKDMLKAKRDNFRKMQEVGGESKMKSINGEIGNKSSASNESSDTSADESDDSGDEPSEKRYRKSGDDESEKMRANDVKLPDTLNDEILKDIEEMKEIVRSQMQFSRNFQFDDKITDVFLKIDDACLCLDKSTRNIVFAHLEYQLSLPKYYLLRKAKQLRIKQEKTKTKKAFTKLKKAVLEIMPSVLLQYEGNYKKIDEMRASISPADLEKMDHPPKYPKKKFHWNENLRNLLYDLYQIRWMSYTVLRTKKEGFEDFVNNYLKDKVVSIWPSGWMKYDDLKKELEKRKMTVKKPKENKKPYIVDLTSPILQKRDETSTANGVSSVSQTLDMVSKSILSSSNSLSVVSTKDLVVTIATKNSSSNNSNNEKLSTSATAEVPCSTSAQNSNSLSVKQVPVDNADIQSSSKNSNNSVLTGKDISSFHKSPKLSSSSSSSNSSSSSTSSGPSKSPSPSHLDHIGGSSSVSSKLSGQNLINYSPINYNKNSSNNNKSNSMEKLNSSGNGNGNGNNSVNSNKNKNINSNKLPNLTITTSPTNKETTIDLISPTKRATDHSISNIISPESGLPIISAINMNTNTKKSPSPSDTATTHVINVDDLKCTTDIINTTNQLLNNSNNGGGGGGSSNSTTKDRSIRIRSFAHTIGNTNNSLDNDHHRINDSNNGGFLKPDIKNLVQEHDSSSESDGVEIVGVYPAAIKKQQNISPTTNKSTKNKKNNKVSSRSDSPVNHQSATASNVAAVAAAAAAASGSGYAAVQNLTKMAKISSTGDIKESELDVNQIMKALKELEEMQQSSIHITNSSPPSSMNNNNNNNNNRSGSSSSSTSVSHTSSSISYGKDIKQ